MSCIQKLKGILCCLQAILYKDTVCICLSCCIVDTSPVYTIFGSNRNTHQSGRKKKHRQPPYTYVTIVQKTFYTSSILDDDNQAPLSCCTSLLTTLLFYLSISAIFCAPLPSNACCFPWRPKKYADLHQVIAIAQHS
jgi:hypothetical protein